ncbi:hypothetical protein Tco_1166398 [Tanacetum coccineum]
MACWYEGQRRELGVMAVVEMNADEDKMRVAASTDARRRGDGEARGEEWCGDLNRSGEEESFMSWPEKSRPKSFSDGSRGGWWPASIGGRESG